MIYHPPTVSSSNNSVSRFSKIIVQTEWPNRNASISVTGFEATQLGSRLLQITAQAQLFRFLKLLGVSFRYEDLRQLKFSFKTMIFFATLAAVILGVYKIFGANSLGFLVLLGILLGLIFAGILSYRDNLPIPFIKCLVAYFLFFIWGMSTHTGPLSKEEAVYAAVVIGIGLVLSFSSVREGNWATKVMGLIIFFQYASFFCIWLFNGFRSWSNITDYWLGC